MLRNLPIVLVIISLMGFVTHETGKGKQFIFKNYYVASYTYNYTDQDYRPLRIVQYFLNGQDSILVYHGQDLITSFHLENGLISDSSLLEYDSGRMALTYTFSKRKGWFGTGAQHKILYGRFKGMITSEKVYWPNGRLKLERYIGRSSADSIEKTWYSSGGLQRVETQRFRGEYDGNGHLLKEVLYYQWGGDSLIREWYPGGAAISRVWTRDREMKYYANGVLREVYAGNREAYYDSTGIIMHEANTDTLIEGHSLMYTREYDKGILQYEKFFGGYEKDQPCYTWKEYDKHGKPIRTISKTPLKAMPVLEESAEGHVAGYREEKIFEYASQNPEYIGGTEALNTYLENALKALDKKMLKRLKGPYRLNIRVHQDGKVGFISIVGESSVRLTEAIVAIAEAMKWKPARIDGRLIESEVAIMFEVK